ncbi:beta-N-acetylhexosaminidase [Pseudomonadota bacterium]
MSLGPVMVGLSGVELTPEEREMLLHPLVGAVILFSRNFENHFQIIRLVGEVHALRQPRLLVAVDHEGGRVQRFRDGFTHLPAARRFGELYDEDAKRAKRLAETAGWLMAAELRAIDIDFSFAPVLDVDRGISSVIGDRAFHSDPEVVSTLAQSYISGMNKAGMSATGKHFPGHGAVEVDTHLGVASDSRSYADIESEDLVPFERLIRAGLAGVMPAHVIYSSVDKHPAGFSRFWLQQVLRKELRFQGAIFSDDLLMEGAAVVGDVEQRAEAALEAGCDTVLVCDNFSAISKTLDHLERFDNPASHSRLARMHGRRAMNHEKLQNSPQWHQSLHALEPWL